VHPIASHELARIRIDELQAEAARERLAATARAARIGERRHDQHFGFAQPFGVLRRLLGRLAPAPSAG
jgi:hypothetical protein